MNSVRFLPQFLQNLNVVSVRSLLELEEKLNPSPEHTAVGEQTYSTVACTSAYIHSHTHKHKQTSSQISLSITLSYIDVSYFAYLIGSLSRT